MSDFVLVTVSNDDLRFPLPRIECGACEDRLKDALKSRKVRWSERRVSRSCFGVSSGGYRRFGMPHVTVFISYRRIVFRS